VASLPKNIQAKVLEQIAVLLATVNEIKNLANRGYLMVMKIYASFQSVKIMVIIKKVIAIYCIG